MPPRLNLLSFTRTVPFRTSSNVQWCAQPFIRSMPSQCRSLSDLKEPPPANDRSKKTESQPLPHVSEEAAKTAEIEGKQGPEVEKGTPVEEVVKGDKEAQDKLPKVMQDSIKAKNSPSPPKGTRSYSTMTSLAAGGEQDTGLLSYGLPLAKPEESGVKFGLPTLPIPKDGHLKYRYDPLVKQVTNLLMQHGKLSVAQRNMALILSHLRTAPVPTINPARPLLPGAPPPSHLPLNPILYLTLAIDSIAPLLRLRSQKGAAGGGMSLQIPVPLGQRQRRRTAVQWILSTASKKRSRGSGKGSFAQRVAEELVSVVEGKSSLWERRNGVHKLGVSARANIVLPKKR